MFDEIRIVPCSTRCQVGVVTARHGPRGRLGLRSTKGQVVGRERLHHPAASDIELDRVLSALSDPIRRDILQRIATDGPQFCGDLDLKYDVAKSTMSYHFKVLRESGLMHTEAIGKHRRITRRDSVIEGLFPGLLPSVGLPPGEGQWQEPADTSEPTARKTS